MPRSKHIVGTTTKVDTVTGPGVGKTIRPGGDRTFSEITGNAPGLFYRSGAKGSDVPPIFGHKVPNTSATNYMAPIGTRNAILSMIYGDLGTPTSSRMNAVGGALSNFESDLYSPGGGASRAGYVNNFTRDAGYNGLLTGLQGQAGDIVSQVLAYRQAKTALARQKKSFLDLAGAITPGPVGQIVSGAGTLSQSKG